MASRPPRSARPRTSSVPAAPAAPGSFADASALPELSYPAAPPGAYSHQHGYGQSPPPPIASPTPKSPGSFSSYGPKSPVGIQFDPMERGQRDAALDRPLHPGRMPSAYTHGQVMDVEGGANVGRKKSLVRPEREKIEPGHRQWHYRTHAAQAENDGQGRMGVLPSATGNAPMRPGANLRRGKSLLAREEDVHESGLALFSRGPTLRRRRTDAQQIPDTDSVTPPKPKGLLRDIPGPKDAWMYYCWFITCLIPNALLRVCGFRTPEQRRAWREKMGLISIIACLMAIVGYVTFGFTQTVCGRPPNRFHTGSIDTGSVVIHGYDYDFSKFNHPRVGDFEGSTNPLFEGDWGAAGNDISFMFQNTGGACFGLLNKASGSQISGSGDNPDWYFPCNIHSQKQGGSGTPNATNYGADTTCHLGSQGQARQMLSKMVPQGQVFYTWDDVHDQSRNLAVFEQRVLDFDLLKWLDKSQITYPSLFDDLSKKNGSFNARDLSMYFSRTKQTRVAQCLEELVTVGFIDTNTVGCVASEVVLYVSLVFIIGVVGIRFGMAVVFAWFFAPRIGNFNGETYNQRMRRMAEIENWTNDIYKPAPSQYRPNASNVGAGGKKKSFLPSTSRFTPQENYKSGGAEGGRRTTVYGGLEPAPKRATLYGGGAGKGAKLTPPESPALFRNSRSSTSLTGENVCPFPLGNIVPQPPADFEPFGFPLMHTICLVTAYSESVEGLRTTLDSLATTDYPNSHKLILIIADGLVRGAGNDLTTPEICLGMMKDLIVPQEEVEPHSYVAIADGHKRHNMAKVYAGFYDYDDATVERSKQQRVPIVLVAKVGNPREAGDAKPGNRGKRDSQIVLMSFLQKVMFDERMTTFEYEFFNAMWRVSGVSPDRYELTLCVDADTKVFPDSLSRLAACMAQDEEIMGLCGETKIANKAETWVTMIQVFEYYISHHMTKAFESMFGGVTCLPGCFSMYRIKAPKGDSGYWVPILANPDIVEHYSENVVDTLHKKNLLLLGEDRYLTTLMLKTFPRRKNMFCPSAVCKTVVPDTFRVLLSQRRRWINSTVHNLFELLLVRDLCGTFCFSMQFVVGMELGGTLVLPAAISFTLYLIIISIIPGGSNTTIPLVLLAIVLGLPGLLIVITSRKLAYVGWMIVYLFSLPVWNGILPMYSFWHFDDFSWGQTRQIAGEKAAENHGDKEGEFDSSHIVMKRWAEFERERRWKSDTQSRDSTYYDPRSSPKRLSLISSSETFQPPSRGFDSPYDPNPSPPSIPSSNPRSRHDSAQLLMLPTPLSVQRPLPSNATGYSRSSEDGGYSAVPSTAMSPTSATQPRMVQSPDRYTQDDPYDHARSPPPGVAGSGYSNARSTTTHRPPSHARTYDPQQQAHVFDDPPQQARRAQTRQEDRHSRAASVERGRVGASGSATGYTSSDTNAPLPPVPAPAPDAVRRVPRSKRPTSTTPQSNRYSQQQSPATSPPPPVNRYSTASPGAGAGISRPASTQQFTLPPGAGAPAYGGRNRYTDVN